MIRIGIDIGSTTAKLVAIDKGGRLVFSRYERHHAKAKETVRCLLKELQDTIGEVDACLQVTGSVGMGFSERCGFPFVQEVVAATQAIQQIHPQTVSMIDIGGEDAKVVFFKDGKATDLRMNGNCAGGTGAFIDQMAVLLDADIDELNRLALQATRIYPIASRCGVFCKTDIQNLVAKNANRADIAASIFHAVAVQTVITLAHGYTIEAPVLFCGGPLTFIPALRKAFTDYLNIGEQEIILPENGTLLPAWGAALSVDSSKKAGKLSELIDQLDKVSEESRLRLHLPALFADKETYTHWKERISSHPVKHAPLTEGRQEVYIGIDSGSTTTKIVVADDESHILFSYYTPNKGNPIQAVENGLKELQVRCQAAHAQLFFKGGCSTGYGEDLIKAAFKLDHGIVETMAHYLAAHYLNPDVSFILDIGGQDMKAIFVDDGVIDRIEINEACSSGCGSFIEAFAKTLGYSLNNFSQAACRSVSPYDLGTRCTVFMNSKVKQALREGATIDDIAAGLAYSVVKNCLYKVLKLKDTSVLGKHIVVQGGTLRNDAVVRALELLTESEVTRCDSPELMGALGCALYARSQATVAVVSLEEMLAKATYESHLMHCKGCDNQCLVVRYRFRNGEQYYSGNRCEKVFTNQGEKHPEKGLNAYQWKEQRLFERATNTEQGTLRIGIPRCLNMYEEYPFWHALFTSCDIKICLSDKSDYRCYEHNANKVMSDNICFPAKLVHSHIQNLIDKQVDRIFMPFVVYEPQGKEQNSYNCPIVTGYAEVVKGVSSAGIPIDSPTIGFKDKKLLYRQCETYLHGLGIRGNRIRQAFSQAIKAQKEYVQQLVEYNEHVYREAQRRHALTVLLAGRPYHTDPLIQHKVSQLLADWGIYVITEDIVRHQEEPINNVHFLAQWAYPNRILAAAAWCGKQKEVQFVQMTSFGCGPDAFLTDEIRDLLARHHKIHTLLKLDDINNIGSMKLRIRSLVESLKLAGKKNRQSPQAEVTFHTTTLFTDECRKRKILVPYFTPFISPLIPAVMKQAGYEVENLPLSNTDSCEWGLKYANNEVCYPATLIVGDVIQAFKSGKYDPHQTAIAMTQTGGQCRASNYIGLIKKALVEAGYEDVPVVSFSLGDSLGNQQPGFRINWMRLLPVALHTILYTDCIAKFYYASVVREKIVGEAARLRDLYLQAGAKPILDGKVEDLMHYLSLAANDFDKICSDKPCPKVGIVGEIFLKFNPFAQRYVTDWLIEQGIEVVPPLLIEFFLQGFVNRRVNEKGHLARKSLSRWIYQWAYHRVKKQIGEVNRTASKFRYFTPFVDIFAEAEEAKKVINLHAQFGEGWLLPAEILSCAHCGVNHVISLQPFGCIANHIVSKGIEKRIKALVPEVNMLSLDFDSGVSDVNIMNRLLLFLDTVRNGA